MRTRNKFQRHFEKLNYKTCLIQKPTLSIETIRILLINFLNNCFRAQPQTKQNIFENTTKTSFFHFLWFISTEQEDSALQNGLWPKVTPTFEGDAKVDYIGCCDQQIRHFYKACFFSDLDSSNNFKRHNQGCVFNVFKCFHCHSEESNGLNKICFVSMLILINK